MTRRANARLAGLTFLLYIAVALPANTLFALCCRVGEGLVIAIFVVPTVALLWLATAGVGVRDAPTTGALAELMLKAQDWATIVSAILFSVGSTFFSYLLLRGRAIPVSLAWLGVLASVLLVVLLPARLVGLRGEPLVWLMWLPMLVFEVALAVWLIVKGVAEPARR